MGGPNKSGDDEGTQAFEGLDALQKREVLEQVLANPTIGLAEILHRYYGLDSTNEFIGAFSQRLFGKRFGISNKYDPDNAMRCDAASVTSIKELTCEKTIELFTIIENEIYDVFMSKMCLKFMDLKKDGLSIEKAKGLLEEIGDFVFCFSPSDRDTAKEYANRAQKYFERRFGKPAPTAQENEPEKENPVQNIINTTGKFHLVKSETAQESQEPPVSQEPTPPQESEPPAELQIQEPQGLQEPPPPGKLENLLVDLESRVDNAPDRKTAEQYLEEAYDIRLIMPDSLEANMAVLEIEKIFRKKFGILPNPDRESLCLALGFCDKAAEKKVDYVKRKNFLKIAFTQSEMILDSKIKGFAISCIRIMAIHLGIDTRDITEQKPAIEDVDDYVETVDEDENVDDMHGDNTTSKIYGWISKHKIITALAVAAVFTGMTGVITNWPSKQKTTATRSSKTPESNSEEKPIFTTPTPSLEQEAKSLASAIVYLTHKSGGLPENSVKLLENMAEDFKFTPEALITDNIIVLKNVYMEVEADGNGNLVTKSVDFGKSGFVDIQFKGVSSAQNRAYLIWTASLESNHFTSFQIFIPKGQLSDVAKAGKYPVFAVAAREYYRGYKER